VGWLLDLTSMVGTGLSASAFSLECFITSSLPQYKIEEAMLVIQTLSPPFVVMMFSLIVLPFMMVKKIAKKLGIIMFITEFVYFFTISSISTELISFFSCHLIGDEYFLKSNL
jgi:uncharacterized membrane protein